MNEVFKIFEHDLLKVGAINENGAVFKSSHLQALSRFQTLNKKIDYYQIFYNSVKFNQYVGAIKVGDITIEVLPKIDRHIHDKDLWQKVLLDMLMVSFQMRVKSTTQSNLSIRKHQVLETYVAIYLTKVEYLVHQGLVKKYRSNESNQYALKGKLLIKEHVSKNLCHAEKFYVSHSVYDRNNLYNGVLKAALENISESNFSNEIVQSTKSLLLYFPDCERYTYDESFFLQLNYDRKTEGYKEAIELAKVILLNYHPDIKGGRNDILAIMFNMNKLWETFINWSLQRAVRTHEGISVEYHKRKSFWKHESNRVFQLEPDLILVINGKKIVIDTKWKNKSNVSIQDIRQLYAYQHYFHSKNGYLLYPDKILEEVRIEKGVFHNTGSDAGLSDRSCGILFADLLIKDNNRLVLNKNIGFSIIETIKLEIGSTQKV